MKKRLLSVLLCLTLATTLIPGTALAETATGSDSPATAVTEEPVEQEDETESPAPASSQPEEDGESSAPVPAEPESATSYHRPHPPRDTGLTVTVGDVTEAVGPCNGQLKGYYTYSPSGHTLTILRDGVTVSGASSKVTLKTASTVSSVTLKNLTLSATIPFCAGGRSGGLTVFLSGSVSLTGDVQAIDSRTDLTIQGGTLTVQGDTGIQTSHSLTLDGVILDATGTEGCGIQCAGGTLSIQNNAQVTASGKTCGIRVTQGALSVRYAGVSAQGSENGIYTDQCRAEVRSAFVEATGSSQSGFRISGGSALTVTDAELTAEGGQDGLRASCTTLSLCGATVNATGAEGVGIAFSGTELTADEVSLVTAVGGTCGLDAPQCALTIDSSTVEATGSSEDSCGLNCPNGTLTAVNDAYLAVSGGAQGICADGTTVTLDCAVAELAALYSGSGLTCSGDTSLSLSRTATLTATGPQCGIYADGCAVTLDGAAVSAEGADAQGLYCRNLTMSGGSELIASGGTDGVRIAGGTVCLDSSSVETTGDTNGFYMTTNHSSVSRDAVYTDDAPLLITAGSSVIAQGGDAGIAANCNTVIRDASVTTVGREQAGIAISASGDSAPSTADVTAPNSNLSIYGASAVSAEGPDHAGIYAAGDVSIDLTRSGSFTSSGTLSEAGIRCSAGTRIVTPKNGYISTCTITFAGEQHTCYAVFAPAHDGIPATIADTVEFGCIEDLPSYTVSFDSDGGSPVDSQTVPSGTCIQEPEPPIRNGFSFLHWVDETGAAFDFDTPVTADLTLTAVWEVFYTVTFHSTGGSLVDSQMVRMDALAQRPEDPVKDGYVFQYWECEDGNEYFFDTPVCSDVVLLAVWEPEQTADSKPGSTPPQSSTDSRTTSQHVSSAKAKADSPSVQSADAPETWDSTPLALLAGGMILAGTGIVGLMVHIRRKGL